WCLPSYRRLGRRLFGRRARMRRFTCVLAACIVLATALGRAPRAEDKAPPANGSNDGAEKAAADSKGDGVEPRFLSHVRRLTFGFVKAGEGYFSPDGRSIIYQAVPEDYPFYQIYTQSLEEGAKPKLVSTGRGRTTCSNFSPDGK